MHVSRKCFASNDFNLKDEHHILLDEKYFGISFHNDTALLVRASLPYFLVFAILTFKNPLEEQYVSYLSQFEQNVNQWLKIDGRWKLIDLLIKKAIFNNDFVMKFKGYLGCKMITSQNVSSES